MVNIKLSRCTQRNNIGSSGKILIIQKTESTLLPKDSGYSKEHLFNIPVFAPVFPYSKRNMQVKFLFNKTNRCTNFPNLFCQETLHVSGSSSSHHQEFSNVHSALYMSCRFDDSFQARPGQSCLKADDGQRKCRKQVEFLDKINLANQCIWLVLLKRNLLRRAVT